MLQIKFEIGSKLMNH